MSRRHLQLVLLSVAVVTCAALGLWWYWAPLHKQHYTHANDLLIETLEPFPGARPEHRVTRAYTHGCETVVCVSPQRTIGYESDVTYVVPRAQKASTIVAWYARQLRSWGGAPELAEWRRGDDWVAVRAGPSPVRTFELQADANRPRSVEYRNG